VVMKEGHAPSEAVGRELRDLAKARLSPYKYPRWVRFVVELPRNERGKVERKRIRDGFALTDVHPLVELTGAR
jgi:acetyl-CoA synthetase